MPALSSLHLAIFGDAKSGQEALSTIKKAIGDNISSADRLALSFKEMANSSEGSGRAIMDARTAIQELSRDVANAERLEKTLTKQQDVRASALGRLGRATQLLTTFQRRNADMLTRSSEEVQASAVKHGMSFREAEQASAAAARSRDAIIAKERELRGALARSTIAFRTADAAMKTTSAELSTLQGKYGDNSSRLFELRDSIKKVNTEMGQIQGTSITSAQTLDKMSGSTAHLASELDRMEAETGQTFVGQKALASGLQVTSAELDRQSVAVSNLSVQNREMVRTTQQANRDINFLGIKHTPRAMLALNQLSSAAHGAMLGMGALNGNLMQVGFSMIFLKFSMVPVSAAFAAATFLVAKFKRQLDETRKNTRNIQAMALQLRLAGASSLITAKAIEIATELSEEFGFETEDVTKGVGLLIGQGIKPERASMIKLAQVAAATGRTFEEVANIMVKLIKPAEHTITDFSEFEDVLRELIPVGALFGTNTVEITQILADLFGQTAKNLDVNDRLATVIQFLTDEWKDLALAQKVIIEQDGGFSEFGQVLTGVLSEIQKELDLTDAEFRAVSEAILALGGSGGDIEKIGGKFIELVGLLNGDVDKALLLLINSFGAVITAGGNIAKANLPGVVGAIVPEADKVKDALGLVRDILEESVGPSFKQVMGAIWDDTDAVVQKSAEMSVALATIKFNLQEVKNKAEETAVAYTISFRNMERATASLATSIKEGPISALEKMIALLGQATAAASGIANIAISLPVPAPILPLPVPTPGGGTIGGIKGVRGIGGRGGGFGGVIPFRESGSPVDVTIDLRGANILSEKVPDKLVDQISKAMGDTMTTRGSLIRTRR